MRSPTARLAYWAIRLWIADWLSAFPPYEKMEVSLHRNRSYGEKDYPSPRSHSMN